VLFCQPFVDVDSSKAQPFARQLLENGQGGQFKELQVFRGKSPQEHTLAEIVIHMSAALQCVGSGSLAQPLYTLLTNPSTMQVSVIELHNSNKPPHYEGQLNMTFAAAFIHKQV